MSNLEEHANLEAVSEKQELKQLCRRWVGGGAVLFLLLGSVVLYSFYPSWAHTRKKRALSKEADETVAQIDLWYREYLTGDVATARSRLIEAAKLIGASRNTNVVQGGMWFCYARLHCLEKRVGDPALAQIYFEKARYWRLVSLEGNGFAVTNIVAKLDSFTPSACDEFVDDWDRKFTRGAGASYLQVTNRDDMRTRSH